MFNDLVNLYCSYCDLAEYYRFGNRDWNWKEKFLEYRKLARDVEKLLKEMCEEE